ATPAQAGAEAEATPAQAAAGDEAAPTGAAADDPAAQAAEPPEEQPLRFLLIQTANEVVLAGRRLELRDVSQATVYVALASSRAQGQVPTVSLVSRWSDVSERLPDGAMTGTLSLLDEDEGAVLKLRSPMLKSGNLVYEVEVVAGPKELDGGAGSLFVDVVGSALDPSAIDGSRRRAR
ncbi:MAG: hypothetical protein ACR2P8_07285, partial [Myxococcota bacterium]